MSLAIRADGISKAYQLGAFSTGTLAHDINRWFQRVRGKEDAYGKLGEEDKPSRRGSNDIVWSLKDISFDIEEGAAVGIIGKNGAGKSTLLKILSRVTTPTRGNIKVKGRIASLLEVGTGFHPELTGRENIFLNGALLGMREHEIRRKFDAIVDFSGVERYIDTPVKRYSSGMYVRLAFAVAAHLESEILIVDEVLAVGDADFQKKCLGKMGEVSKGEGRTVLFVSHNMSSVQALCQKGIVLHKGTVVYDGTLEQAVDAYSRLNVVAKRHVYTGKGLITTIEIRDPAKRIFYNSAFSLLVGFQSPQFIRSVVVGISIKDHSGVPVVAVNNRHYHPAALNSEGIFGGVVQVTFQHLKLLPGLYTVDVYLGDTNVDIASVHDQVSFEVEESVVNATNHPINLKVNRIFMEDVEWKLEEKITAGAIG